MEGFLAENVSVTPLIKMLLSSRALFACIMSLKETSASKHMGISMESEEVTCIDTELYGRCLKPVGMTDLLAAGRIYF